MMYRDSRSDFRMTPVVSLRLKRKDSIQEGIENVLWNQDIGAWLDYDIKRGKQRDDKNNFYPSNIAPLWAECYP